MSNRGKTQRGKTRFYQKRDREWEPSERQLEIYAAVAKGDRKNTEIAAQYGVNRSLITHTVKKVNDWLVPRYAEDIRGIKAKHTHCLEVVFAEAMTAWEESKRPAVTTTVETDEDGKKVKKTQTRYQCGNPSFLAEARDALEQIRKIWGADAPSKVEHSGELRVAGMSLEEANQQLASELQSVLQQITTPTEN